ncbi:amidohydrolase family protein [Paeniglutamicibacter kerguelensis]
MERLDAHLHLWQIGDPGAYPWLTPDLGELYADFTPSMAEAELADSAVDGAILVQAADTLADTEFMLGVAAEYDWVLGVVGWVDLCAPQSLEDQLESWRGSGPFCGVRHLVHDDPRADFLERPDVSASLELLAKHDIPLDIPDAFPRHLDQALRVAARHPDLRIVVDHLAKPPLGSSDGAFAAWRDSFTRLAQLPQVFTKLSGLRIPHAGYDVSKLRPAFDVALEAFGPGRMMYGGDWPMTVPAGGYAPTLRVFETLVGTLAVAEQESLWAGTARRVYPNLRSKIG